MQNDASQSASVRDGYLLFNERTAVRGMRMGRPPGLTRSREVGSSAHPHQREDCSMRAGGGQEEFEECLEPQMHTDSHR